MTWNNPLPPLATEELERLTADVVENGVRTPLFVAEDGDLLDGWHRKAIAERFSIEYETQIVPGLRSEEEKLAFALRVNVNRRNLSPDQKSEVRARQQGIARSLKGQGLTQERIASLLGIPRPTVDNWLSSDVQVNNGGQDNRVKLSQDDEAAILKASDKSVRQLAADLGISKSRVAQVKAKAAKEAEEERKSEIAAAAKKTKAATVAKNFGIDEADVKRIAEEAAEQKEKDGAKALKGSVAQFVDLMDELAKFGKEFPAAMVGPTLVRLAEEDPGRYSIKETVGTIEVVTEYLDDFIKAAANLSGTLKARRAK